MTKRRNATKDGVFLSGQLKKPAFFFNRQQEMEVFNAKTTAEEVLSTFPDSAKGKFVLVTGGGGGLGLETARVLGLGGADVLITARSAKSGEEAVQKIKDQHPNVKIGYRVLELGSLKSIDAFSEEYLESGRPLDILINNAAVMACPRAVTEDGFESQFWC